MTAKPDRRTRRRWIQGTALLAVVLIAGVAVRPFWRSLSRTSGFLRVESRAIGFGGDMRSVHVSFEKIRRALGYRTHVDLPSGIRELHDALASGWVHTPDADRYRNHPPLLS